jgi:integrase
VKPPKDSYHVEYREHGKLKREKVGPKDLASIRMGDIQRAMLEKRHLNINKNAVVTLGDIVRWYSSLIEVMSLRSYKERMRSINAISKGLGAETVMSGVAPALLESWRSGRLQSCEPATVNREITYLKACLNMAMKYEMIETNPISGVSNLKESNHRDVGLTVQQLGVLVNNCPDWIHDVVNVAFYTMMRRGEILGITQSNVDLKEWKITIPAELAKNGESRVVPIPDIIRPIFIAQKRLFALERIFSINGYSVSYFQKTFSEAVKRSQLGDFHFHDLRHASAQWYHENGNSVEVIMQIGGWSNFDMLKRYLFNKNKALNVKFG